jgi:hypothetical protein
MVTGDKVFLHVLCCVCVARRIMREDRRERKERGENREKILGHWSLGACNLQIARKDLVTKKCNEIRRWFLMNFELGVLFF